MGKCRKHARGKREKGQGIYIKGAICKGLCVLGRRCRSGVVGGRVGRAKKKRALHSRFNRKTSFIRSFIIIKEPGKSTQARGPGSRPPLEGGWKKKKGEKERKKRKRERARKRYGENETERRGRRRALRYYFGSLIIFPSTLLDPHAELAEGVVGGRGRDDGDIRKRDSSADVPTFRSSSDSFIPPLSPYHPTRPLASPCAYT